MSKGVAAVARAADKANEVVKLGAETLAENLSEMLTAMLVQIVTTAVTVDHIAGIHIGLKGVSDPSKRFSICAT